MAEDRHQQRQQRLKEQVDARIAAAQDTRGLLLVFTGNGRVNHGRLRHRHPGGWPRHARRGDPVHQGRVAQWRKNLLQQHGVEFQVMATGFTWETQNKAGDTAACQAVWQHGKRMLADSSLDLVLLDEVTYMLTYDYLELEELKAALLGRPAHQTVILTGRGCHRDLLELADTVTEMRPVKHAFDAGVKAQQGIDW